jgi:molybdopterin-guanine dinucleotide biosynthesis protein A
VVEAIDGGSTVLIRSGVDLMGLGAVVLCGGESRRMGRSKAWLPFGPERMLQRVVRLVGIAARPIVVVAAPHQELPELASEIAIVRDPIAGRGPLQGLAAGLAALPDSVELVYATATDVPFLEPRWITRLVELIGNDDFAIPFIGEHYHPLAALYRRDAVLPVIEGLLKEDRMRLGSLVDRVKTRIVKEGEMRTVDPGLGTTRNLNDPEAYAKALRDAGVRDVHYIPGT